MLGAASSYVFNTGAFHSIVFPKRALTTAATASSFVYGPPPPPPAASQTTLHPKKKRKTRRRHPPGTKAAEPDAEPVAGPSSAPAGPKARRKGGELGVAYDLVDSINDERDLYKVLGLTKGAKSEDIRRAYIARSRVCHPECVALGFDEGWADSSDSKLPTYPPCTPAFQKLSFAYETLSKPSSRRLYDVGGAKDFTGSVC